LFNEKSLIWMNKGLFVTDLMENGTSKNDFGSGGFHRPARQFSPGRRSAPGRSNVAARSAADWQKRVAVWPLLRPGPATLRKKCFTRHLTPALSPNSVGGEGEDTGHYCEA